MLLYRSSFSVTRSRFCFAGQPLSLRAPRSCVLSTRNDPGPAAGGCSSGSPARLRSPDLRNAPRPLPRTAWREVPPSPRRVPTHSTRDKNRTEPPQPLERANQQGSGFRIPFTPAAADWWGWWQESSGATSLRFTPPRIGAATPEPSSSHSFAAEWEPPPAFIPFSIPRPPPLLPAGAAAPAQWLRGGRAAPAVVIVGFGLRRVKMAAGQGGGGGGGNGGNGNGVGGLAIPAHLTLSFSAGPHWGAATLPQSHTVRSLDRALEEAGSSGILCLSGRKLRDFPGSGYDLSDTTQADLSKNRFTEIPPDVWLFAPLETLNLYHNCIKSIPESIKNLQMLTYLNISRNLLSALPKYLFELPLKVLVVSNNKLVSIPEEIGKLRGLMELDISCNELQVLPQQIGKLQSLRELNIRRNNLHMLPDELGDLPLVKLDFSCNKITEIPICYRKLRHLQVIVLDNNPMQIPPAQICLKGKVHIFKFLSIQACLRIDKKPDSLDLPSLGKRIPSQPLTDSIEDFYPSKNHGPDSGIGSDNGDKRLSTTEPSDDDTISLHSQVSESTKEQTLRNDNHVMGSKLDPQKDQEVYDYIDPNAEEGAVPEQGDTQTGPLLSYIKERGKHPEKPQKIEQNEDWGDQKRLQEEQMLAEDEEELKEVTDLRKIAAQLLQQEQKHRRRPLNYRTSFSEKLFQRTRAAGRASRLLNHSVSVSTRNRPKQPMESEKCVLTDEVNSPVSPYSWQPLGNHKDSVDEQYWPEIQPVIWQNEERRRSKQIRKEYFKYKSSRKSSSGNENDEQDSDNTNVSPQSPVSSEDYERTDSNTHGPFGLKPRSAFSRASRQDYDSVDPGFTMRRKMEHLREEREQIRQLRNNLESRLKVILPDDIGAALMDGVVLCHLANHIRPRSVASIHVPSPAVPKLSMAKCRRNVENFLDACKKLGVPQERLCLPHHILEERGLVKVGLTVQALLELPMLKVSQLSSI